MKTKILIIAILGSLVLAKSIHYVGMWTYVTLNEGISKTYQIERDLTLEELDKMFIPDKSRLYYEKLERTIEYRSVGFLQLDIKDTTISKGNWYYEKS